MSKDDFYRFQKGQTNELIIAFSAATVPAGKFSFSNILTPSNSNVLYLNCPENTWYVNKVNDEPEQFNYYIKIINKIILEEKINYTIFFGGSMGAYGALLYGALLNANEIHCFGLEFELFSPFSNSQKYFKQKTDFIIPNLELIISESSFNTCNIYYGERCIVDLYQASLLPKMHKIKKIPLRELTHSIPPSLIKSFNIVEALDSKTFISDVNNNFYIGDSNIESDPMVFECLYKAYIEFNSGYQSLLTIDRLKAVISNTKSESLKFLCKAYLGLLMEDKLPEEAKNILLEIKNNASFISEVYPALIRLERQYSIATSLETSKVAIEYHKPDILDMHIDILYLHCLNLFSSQMYKEIIPIALEFSSYRPNHNHIRFILAVCYLKIDKKSEALYYSPPIDVLKNTPMYKKLYIELYGDVYEKKI